jgi:hypothetical protein
MDEIIKELIRENIPKYSNGKDMIKHEFSNRVNEKTVYDLLEIVNLDTQMDYLQARHIDYYQMSILGVCNLYVYSLANEILQKDFPKIKYTDIL